MNIEFLCGNIEHVYSPKQQKRQTGHTDT